MSNHQKFSLEHLTRYNYTLNEKKLRLIDYKDLGGYKEAVVDAIGVIYLDIFPYGMYMSWLKHVPELNIKYRKKIIEITFVVDNGT